MDREIADRIRAMVTALNDELGCAAREGIAVKVHVSDPAYVITLDGLPKYPGGPPAQSIDVEIARPL